MTEQLCPICGCTIVGGGYEKEGVKYFYEPCATSGGPLPMWMLPPCGRRQRIALGQRRV